VRCHARVDALTLRRGRVAGVRLQDGQVLPADAVVVALSAARAAALVPADALPGR
jgi:hypothetical protein